MKKTVLIMAALAVLVSFTTKPETEHRTATESIVKAKTYSIIEKAIYKKAMKAGLEMSTKEVEAATKLKEVVALLDNGQAEMVLVVDDKGAVIYGLTTDKGAIAVGESFITGWKYKNLFRRCQKECASSFPNCKNLLVIPKFAQGKCGGCGCLDPLFDDDVGGIIDREGVLD